MIGSDAAGVVLRVGAGVSRCKPGDEVVAHCLSVELEDPPGHDHTMLDRGSASGGSSSRSSSPTS